MSMSHSAVTGAGTRLHPDSRFLLVHTLAGGTDGSSDWGPVTHAGDPDGTWNPSLCSCPGPLQALEK